MFAKMLTGMHAAGALSIPLAGVATATPSSTGTTNSDHSVSVNGVVRSQHGTESAAVTTPTTGTGGVNVAIARNNSTAQASDGSGNKARATNGGQAVAGFGDNKMAEEGRAQLRNVAPPAPRDGTRAAREPRFQWQIDPPPLTAGSVAV
jgi:hypothetical protein